MKGMVAAVLSAVAMALGVTGSAGADQAPDGTKAAKIAAKDAASADWTCSDTHSDKDHSTYPKPFDGATNVRSGPSTSCAVVGVAGTVNKADYHCYVDGDASNENTWAFLRFKDTTTGSCGTTCSTTTAAPSSAETGDSCLSTRGARRQAARRRAG